MSLFAVFSLLVLILLASAHGASISYTVYSDGACSNQINSGSQSAQLITESGGYGIGIECFSFSGVLSGINAAAGECVNATGLYFASFSTYSDSACNTSFSKYSTSTVGGCLTAGTNSSVILTCSNGAFSLAAASLPLLAALSVLSWLVM